MSSRADNPHLTFCIRNKILVYPVLKDAKTRQYQIEVSVNGKKRRFDKIIKADEIDSAMQKTYQYYYDKYKDTPNVRR